MTLPNPYDPEKHQTLPNPLNIIVTHVLHCSHWNEKKILKEEFRDTEAGPRSINMNRFINQASTNHIITSAISEGRIRAADEAQPRSFIKTLHTLVDIKAQTKEITNKYKDQVKHA